MTAKYTDMLDVVRATLEKFEKVDKLNRGAAGCNAHTINGIGCAVSCHFDPEFARRMDEKGVYGIQTSRNMLSLRATIDSIFDPSLVEELSLLQGAHDHAPTIGKFRNFLRMWLETGKQPFATVPNWRLVYSMIPDEKVKVGEEAIEVVDWPTEMPVVNVVS